MKNFKNVEAAIIAVSAICKKDKYKNECNNKYNTS